MQLRNIYIIHNCLCCSILRKKEPNRPRPFKVPFSPWSPIIGIICCAGLMVCKLTTLSDSAILFPLWLIIGAAIYFAYGYSQNRLAEQNPQAQSIESTENDKVSL